jgi:hypothetical protein
VLPLNLGRYTRVFALNGRIPRRQNFQRIYPRLFIGPTIAPLRVATKFSSVFPAAKYSSVHCDSHPYWKE